MTSRPQDPVAQRLAGYRRPDPNTQPEYNYPPYASTVRRSPSRPLVVLPTTLSEVTGPLFGPERIGPTDHDLTLQGDGAPIGERIIVSGRVLDGNGRPVPHTLVEVWQANAAGRYPHPRDQHDAPLDPNFPGAGRTLTDADGRYRFVTIRPGEYPWRNHYNAWRPAHIHFSLFGPAIATRLVTQMYFPGDPLMDDDPMFNSVPDERARKRLISHFDWETTIPETALGYKFDIVLRGRDETPMENYLPAR
jgi:protocatechuate 3,4-dioxygenase beta subunit